MQKQGCQNSFVYPKIVAVLSPAAIRLPDMTCLTWRTQTHVQRHTEARLNPVRIHWHTEARMNPVRIQMNPVRIHLENATYDILSSFLAKLCCAAHLQHQLALPHPSPMHLLRAPLEPQTSLMERSSVSIRQHTSVYVSMTSLMERLAHLLNHRDPQNNHRHQQQQQQQQMQAQSKDRQDCR